MRRADWRSRLYAYLAQAATKPFEPGRHDCALFAAGAVKAMTGKDPARGLRGYRTLAVGHRHLRKAGYADHVAVAASLFDEVPILMAMVGDLAVVATDEGPALGVVIGSMVQVLRPEGMGFVPLTDVDRAFRV